MGAQNHVHDWTAIPGGWACTLQGCTATMSDAELGANKPTMANQTSSNGGWNIAYKKIHG